MRGEVVPRAPSESSEVTVSSASAEALSPPEPPVDAPAVEEEALEDAGGPCGEAPAAVEEAGQLGGELSEDGAGVPEGEGAVQGQSEGAVAGESAGDASEGVPGTGSAGRGVDGAAEAAPGATSPQHRYPLRKRQRDGSSEGPQGKWIRRKVAFVRGWVPLAARGFWLVPVPEGREL